MRSRSALRNWIEFVPACLLLKSLVILPRSAAMMIGKAAGRAAYYLHGRLRLTAFRNLSLAMPDLDEAARTRVVKGVFDNFGRLLGEFSQFPKIRSDNIVKLVVYEGLENYTRAAAEGRGVLFLTGHFGAWELCAFAHGASGNPLNFLVRPIDNPYIDRMISRYRSLSGNHTIDKSDAVKPVLAALKRREAVGFLIDINTFEDQGVFCGFFGIPACTTTGLAIFALRTDAPVVPGFLIWNEKLKRHCLRFEPALPVVRTGDFKEEVRLNTAAFTRVIEQYARRYPDQWLWVHKRWKTRPEGEPDLYNANHSPSESQPDLREAQQRPAVAGKQGA
ncbi:MAG TPA: lysophospholipid acyltransferase family protein [Blastocatellia bacterium]|nr:lysophospholipid acyltransferase family protein [Blastocatellia bacterium]